MRDTVCPIGECTATVRFEASVVEVTPRYQLHDLGEVDEFATCPGCDADVAGFYDEDANAGSVELVLDDEEPSEADDVTTDDEEPSEADDAAADSSGGDVTTDDDAARVDAAFDDPEDVLAAVEDSDDAERDDSVFGDADS